VRTVRFTAALYSRIAERLGYTFTDRALLRHSLTHASSRRKHDDYERLEFLGDRVLGLVLAELLYKQFPKQDEGGMAARHSALVRGEACAAAGRALGLEEFIIMGETEMHKGMHLKPGVIGDVMEALIAGIYLDGGLEEARRFILKNWEMLLADGQALTRKDAKTFLQEWVLARSSPIPVYKPVSRTGPEHAPVFVVAVEVKGCEPMEGTGPSKRAAEQDAATKFLRRESIRA
jgi:ribonuclease III